MSDDQPQPWTDEENDLIVQAYMEMYRDWRAELPVNKAQVNSALQAATGRSRGSIEFKHQNISSVLNRLGLPFLQGYPPRPNVQRSLVDAVERDLALVEQDVLRETMRDGAALPTGNLTLVDPPWRSQLHPSPVWSGQARQVDWGAVNRAQRELGAAGELLVLSFERECLNVQGRPDLAARVEHVSVTRGDGLGYDVASFDASGNALYIEVKTTVGGLGTPFEVSEAEVQASEALGDQYALYRVFGIAGEAGPSLYVVRGDLRHTMWLRPSSYLAAPRLVQSQ